MVKIEWLRLDSAFNVVCAIRLRFFPLENMSKASSALLTSISVTPWTYPFLLASSRINLLCNLGKNTIETEAWIVDYIIGVIRQKFQEDEWIFERRNNC